MPLDPAILSRARKLQALAADASSEHEADQALAALNRLYDKHPGLREALDPHATRKTVDPHEAVTSMLAGVGARVASVVVGRIEAEAANLASRLVSDVDSLVGSAFNHARSTSEINMGLNYGKIEWAEKPLDKMIEKHVEMEDLDLEEGESRSVGDRVVVTFSIPVGLLQRIIEHDEGTDFLQALGLSQEDLDDAFSEEDGDDSDDDDN